MIVDVDNLTVEELRAEVDEWRGGKRYLAARSTPLMETHRQMEELQESHDDLVDTVARLVNAIEVVTGDPEFSEPGVMEITKGQKEVLVAALAADQEAE